MNSSGYSTHGKWLTIILAAFLSIVMVRDSHAQQNHAPLVLTDDQDTYDLLDHLEVYVDTSTELTFDQITSQEFNGEFEPAGGVDTMSGSPLIGCVWMWKTDRFLPPPGCYFTTRTTSTNYPLIYRMAQVFVKFTQATPFRFRRGNTIIIITSSNYRRRREEKIRSICGFMMLPG